MYNTKNQAYCKIMHRRSVEAQYRAFDRGFKLLLHGPALGLFNATELERLVRGCPELDFEALQATARWVPLGGVFLSVHAGKRLFRVVMDCEGDGIGRLLAQGEVGAPISHSNCMQA